MVDLTGHAVSFVIPALNEELLIGRCINSIKREVERTGIEAEIIVVDNGSTDATACVALVKKVKVVVEKQRGLQAAKARGLAEAKYPVIATIDADCMLREGWITRVINAFKDTNVVAVSGPYRYYDIKFAGRYLSNSVFGAMALLGHVTPMLMGGNAAYRSHALKQAGGFDPSFTFWGEDTDIAVRVGKIGRVKFDIRMRVDSSGRRLIEQGYLNTFATYCVNNIAVRWSGQALTKDYWNFR